MCDASLIDAHTISDDAICILHGRSRTAMEMSDSLIFLFFGMFENKSHLIIAHITVSRFNELCINKQKMGSLCARDWGKRSFEA